MTIAQDFIKKLQAATHQQFWEAPPEEPTFQDVLDQFAIYYQRLSRDEFRVELSNFFWDKIKAIGTPIIEEKSAEQCEVYFLFPRDRLSDSDEKLDTKKELYLQGDFHGYDTTDGRQQLAHFKNTGIMLRNDTIPRAAILTYRYVQLEPSLRGKTPMEHHGSALIEPLPVSFFPKRADQAEREIMLPQTKHASDEFWGKDSQLVDEYCTHRPAFFGIESPEKILRISTDSSRAHLHGEEVNWPSLLSTEALGNSNRKFIHHDTLYSDLQGDLKHCEAPNSRNYATPSQLFSGDDSSPYSQFTRAIHVFIPTTTRIDLLVVVNDGIPYLSMGIMDYFEEMAEEGRLSPNTAFVFVTCLPGLVKTVSALDSKASMPGMGERTVDYELKIDAYVDFIGNKLLPGLDTKHLKFPVSSSNRVMIGSSLSGTASLYMALNRPDLFGGVIVQSPSPSNRSILTKVVKQYVPSKPRANIHLSCGVFESPRYAANTNLPYAVELSQRLHISLQPGVHGHQFVAWALALKQSLPNIIRHEYCGSMTKLLMQNNSLFRKLEDQHLSEHRHDDPRLQREYDNQFGLMLKR